MYKMNMSDKKWEIFEAAVNLFADRSYSSVSMRELASHVGIQVGSIYNYFPSKDDILTEIYDYYTGFTLELLPDTREVMARAETDHPHKLLWDCIYHSYPPENERLLCKCFVVIASQLSSDERAYDVLNLVVDRPMENCIIPVLEKMYALGRIEMVNLQVFKTLYVGLSYYISYAFARESEHVYQYWPETLNAIISLVRVREPLISN